MYWNTYVYLTFHISLFLLQALTQKISQRERLQERQGQARRVGYQARGCLLELLGFSQCQTESPPKGRQQETLRSSQGWAQRAGYPLKMRPQVLL